MSLPVELLVQVTVDTQGTSESSRSVFFDRVENGMVTAGNRTCVFLGFFIGGWAVSHVKIGMDI